jgi:hypothetical protein
MNLLNAKWECNRHTSVFGERYNILTIFFLFLLTNDLISALAYLNIMFFSFVLHCCLIGPRCGCRRHRFHRLLPAVQTVYSQVDKKAGKWATHPSRFALYSRSGFYVHQVSCRCKLDRAHVAEGTDI